MTTLDTRRDGDRIAARSDLALQPVEEAAAACAISLADGVTSNTRRTWRPTTRGAPPVRCGETDDEMRTLHLVRQSRRGAVWLTVGIATVSFVLSFTSLRELAAMSAWPGWPSWLWPLIIDGTIILATLGIVSFAPYRNQFWNQVFLWLVLGIAALVSLGGNSFHAWLSTSHLPGWMRIGSAGLACVPPAALLGTTHILAMLWRFNPTPAPDPTAELRDRALELAVEKMSKWEASAAELQAHGYCRNDATAQVAHALRYLFEFTPKMSWRSIGDKPEVGFHHDKVGKVEDAAKAVLGLTRRNS